MSKYYLFNLLVLLLNLCGGIAVSISAVDSEVSLSWFNRLKSSKKEFEFCTSGTTNKKAQLLIELFY